MIRCEKHEDGCTWEGNLADLQCHLLNHCSYIEIDCQNKCGSRFVRHRMSQHKCTKKQSSVDEKRVLSLEEITDKILSLEKKQEREMSVLKPELTKFNTTMNNGSVTSDKQMKLVLEVHALKQKLAESEIRGNALAVKVKQQEQEMKVFRETQNEFRHQFDNLVGKCILTAFRGRVRGAFGNIKLAQQEGEGGIWQYQTCSAGGGGGHLAISNLLSKYLLWSNICLKMHQK